MAKVRIEMDEGYRWWPVTIAEQTANAAIRYPMTLEVPDDLLVRYKQAYTQYRQLQVELEQLYRVQVGLAPWESDPVPEHKVL